MPTPFERMMERAYSVTPVCPSLSVHVRDDVSSFRLSFSGISNLRLSFLGVSNLHLSFSSRLSLSFGHISSSQLFFRETKTWHFM